MAQTTSKEQQTAALNTLINLSLQIAREQQAQVQNSANLLAVALGLAVEAPPAEGSEEAQEGKDKEAEA
jgi:hypothetical protein